MSNSRPKKFVHVWIMRQTSLWGAWHIFAQKRLWSNTLKRNELKVYIPLKVNKLACFANRHMGKTTYFCTMSLPQHRPNPIFNLDTKFPFFLKSVLCRPNFDDTIVESRIFKQFCMFLLSLCWSWFFLGSLITDIDPVIAGHLSK